MSCIHKILERQAETVEMHKRRVYQSSKCFLNCVAGRQLKTSIHAQSQKIKVIQFLPIPHNIALDLAGVDPGHKVLHIASHQESRVSDNLSPDTDMALLNKRSRLRNQISTSHKSHTQAQTHSLNSLNHPRPHHQHRQSPPTKRRNGNLPLNPRQPSPLLARLLQNPHPPQLIQHLRLELLAHGVRVWVQLGEFVRELPERAAYGVVLLVVHWVLEKVSLADLVLAVVAVGFVGVEIDLSEESACC